MNPVCMKKKNYILHCMCKKSAIIWLQGIQTRKVYRGHNSSVYRKKKEASEANYYSLILLFPLLKPFCCYLELKIVH